MAFGRGLRSPLSRVSSSAIFLMVSLYSSLAALIAASRFLAACSLIVLNAFMPTKRIGYTLGFKGRMKAAHLKCHCRDHPFQKHTQVRLRVHYIVIPRLCQSEFFSVSIPSPYGVETGIQASAHSCIRFSSRFRNSRSSSPSDSVRQHGILEIRTFNSSISF